MKKIRNVIFVILMMAFLLPKNVAADNKVNIYFFHGDGCPHCLHEEEWLETIKTKYSNVEIQEYEVWYNEENNALMEQIKTLYEVTGKGVPFTIIGDQTYLGFSDSIGINMESKIRECSKHVFQDQVGVFLKINSEIEQGEELEPWEDTNQTESNEQNQIAKEKAFQEVWGPLIVFGSVLVIAVGTITGILIYRKRKLERVH